MPQLLALVLIGAAAVAGYKSFHKAFGRTSAGSRREDQTKATSGSPGMKDLGSLELDPQSGVYKPREG